MSMTSICGAESTLVHVGMSRPAVGLLICAALGTGGWQMTGTPDAFGGCGVTGGELHRVIDYPPEPQQVCAMPEQPPVAVSK